MKGNQRTVLLALNEFSQFVRIVRWSLLSDNNRGMSGLARRGWFDRRWEVGAAS